MIKKKELYGLDPFPKELNIPNKDIILELIYCNYSKFKSIEDIDRYFKKNITSQKHYKHTLRPIIKLLFDLNRNNQSIPSIKEIDKLKIVSKSKISHDSTNSLIDDFINDFERDDFTNNFQNDTYCLPTEEINFNIKINYDTINQLAGIKQLELNKSQLQVLDYYKNYGLHSGIICHATGTGKTYCIFLTIGYFQPDVVYILCSYKNILHQMFYNSDGLFDYEKFAKLKYGNFFDISMYDVYDLSNSSNQNRKDILRKEHLDYINSSLNHRKKMFIMNYQFIGNDDKYTLLPKPDMIIHDELHSITGSTTYKILSYYKELGSKIIGLSATPIRNIHSETNYDKLKYIYSDNTPNINIISSYENIKAIINDDILNICINWFEASLINNAKLNRSDESNIRNCLNCILNTIQNNQNNIPNRKVLVWCKTIDHTELIYKTILNDQRFIDLFHNGIFMDHSKTETEINNFKKIKSNTVLICAEKYREGSDIEYLDMIVFADFVKDKSELPFIQCIGRVQRKGYNKTIGTVIDHYDVSSNYEKKTKDIVNKLIGYYQNFFSSGQINKLSQNNIQEALEMYNNILNRYKFIKNADSNIIEIKLDDLHHIKINTSLGEANFENLNLQFTPLIVEHINKELQLDQDNKLSFEYESFRILNQNNGLYGFKTKTEYYNNSDEYMLEKEPEIKYAKIWKNWYHYLGIDTTIYPPTKKDWQNLCKQFKIKRFNDYYKKAEQYNLPLMPEELYNIKSLVSEFTDENLLYD